MFKSTGTPIQRFRALIQVKKSTQCWEWRHKRRPSFWNGTKHELAYRFAYRYFVGQIPDGMMITVTRLCCNPSHLFVGTNAANMADAARKGRMSFGPSHSGFQPKGEAVYCAKLTADDVRWIRENYIPRHPTFGNGAMSRKFGVSDTAIAYARTGRNWQSVHLRPPKLKE
jgi:hypothetical protein